MEPKLEVDLLDFLRPMQAVSDYEDYLQEVCDKLMQQIQIAQRRQRVESSKQEMIHRNLYTEYPNDADIFKAVGRNEQTEEVPPIIALIRETSFRTAQHVHEIANSPPPASVPPATTIADIDGEEHLSESGSDSKSVDSLTTTTQSMILTATTPPVRVPNKSATRSFGAKKQQAMAKFSPERRPRTAEGSRVDGDDRVSSQEMRTTVSSARSLGPDNYVEEEVFWDLRFAQNVILRESRLFHFGSCWWSLLFGINNANPAYFYFFITPAEKLKNICQISVEFCVHPHNTYPNGVKPLPVYRRASSRNYIFPPDVNVSRGFDKFIGEEIKPYISAMGKVRLSVKIASAVGANGDLIGHSGNIY